MKILYNITVKILLYSEANKSNMTGRISLKRKPEIIKHVLFKFIHIIHDTPF